MHRPSRMLAVFVLTLATAIPGIAAPAQASTPAPDVPRVKDLKLEFPDRPCGTLNKRPAAGNYTYLSATPVNADPDAWPPVRYAAWPVEHPDQRTEFDWPPLDLSGHPDGTVMAWTAQARGADGLGPWGRTCYLTVDNTRPAAAPLVYSRKYGTADYPGSGGPGVTGTFVFDARGDRDVVSFEYGDPEVGFVHSVRAHRPGGRAKVTVKPTHAGPNRLVVWPLDAAGNRGPENNYDFFVRDTAPFIEVQMNGIGLTSRITLTSQAAEVTSFGYTVDGGRETRLPASGGTATGELTFRSIGDKTVVAKAYAGRRVIGSDTLTVFATDKPKITSAEFGGEAFPIVGRPGSFTFTPRLPGVVSYRYDFGDGGPEQTIAAGPDGSAVLPWTPETYGVWILGVTAVTASGAESQQSQLFVSVVDARPVVSVDDGTGPDGGVGRPVRISLWSDLPGVNGFVYSFEGGPDQPVGTGNFATVDVVPTHAGENSFTARVRLADGTLSPPTTITFTVTSAPTVTPAGPYGPDVVRDREATFTFRPGTPGVTEYRYSFSGRPSQTVPAGPDGTATVTYTPTEVFESLEVTGNDSDTRQFFFVTVDQAPGVTGTWSEFGSVTGAGVPGTFRFFGNLYDATVKFVWRVDDGPEQEVAQAGGILTTVPYTPPTNGNHTLHVRRVFTDGVVSPATAYPFVVGTGPGIESSVYPRGESGGGPGVTGSFRFFGGVPGVVSYDYRFRDDSTFEEVAAGTATVGADGSARVDFTPPAARTYEVSVFGRTADGTRTESSTYSFTVGSAART